MHCENINSKHSLFFRYEGPLSDDVAFAKALDGGPKSLEYTKLVHILAEEIKQLCNLEETVNMMNDPDESSSFLLELSSFLKELGCPYKKLITGMSFLLSCIIQHSSYVAFFVIYYVFFPFYFPHPMP